MEQNTLKYLRILIPGLLILIGLLPVKDQVTFLGISLKGLDDTYVIMLALLLGAIYYQLNIQRWITKPSHYVINRKLFEGILAIYGRQLDGQAHKSVWSKRYYSDVFYNLIDKDDSLKSRARLVYFNGIFWTSSADVLLISLAYFLLYRFGAIITPNKVQVLSSFFVLVFLSLALHIISIYKHIGLGKDQLDYIALHHRSTVIEKLDDVLQRTL